MSSAQNRGQFVWHELMTTDAAGAGDFYPRLAGWKTQPWEGDSSYTLWVGRDGPLGGVVSLPGEAAASSHWMPYIGTEDVAATVAAARDLGATVTKDTTQLPNGGSYAVLQDPQGATFAVHASGADAAGSAQEPNDFSWHELSTADLGEALAFYTELFGWEAAERHDMGEIGFYQLISHHGRNIGGMYVTPPTMAPHWLSYLRVSDVDEAADAAKAAGGRVLNGPMEVPGGDWIAQLIDPQGAAFAVHEVKAAAPRVKAQSSPKAKPGQKQKAAKPVEARAEPDAPVIRQSASRKSKSTPKAKAKSKARSRVAAKPAKAAKRAAAAPKAKRKASARRAPSRGRGAAKGKALRKRASARAAAAARSKRSARMKRPAGKRASAARRRPAARKTVARRTTRRTARTKRR